MPRRTPSQHSGRIARLLTYIAEGSIKSTRIAEGAVETACVPDDVITEPAMLRRLIVRALRDNLRVSEGAAERCLCAHRRHVLGRYGISAVE
ncbi:hypothetical protein ACFXJO_25330 [Streptomyces lavendulae]|uniref:hypothetical protein n=1 Tax=Streptomyces lavendulae TaxID=1914 RepID=UPI003693FEB9